MPGSCRNIQPGESLHHAIHSEATVWECPTLSISSRGSGPVITPQWKYVVSYMSGVLWGDEMSWGGELQSLPSREILWNLDRSHKSPEMVEDLKKRQCLSGHVYMCTFIAQ